MTITSRIETPYKGAPQVQRLVFHEDPHTPYNKRPYQVESIADLILDRNAIGGWISLELRETVETKAGPQTRVVIMTLEREQVAKLLEFLAPEIRIEGPEAEKVIVDVMASSAAAMRRITDAG